MTKQTGRLGDRETGRGRSVCLLVSCLLVSLSFLLLFPADAEAARLALQLVGTAIGAYFGGPFGAALGGMLGGLAGGLLFPEKGPTLKGPRLEDKTVMSSAPGAHIIRHWGADRKPAALIFSSGLKETKHKSEVGGKGMTGGSQTSVTYTYSVDLMLSFGRRAKGVKRIWADTKLIFDVSGEADIKKIWSKEGKKFVVRDGNEEQLPSALEESYHGAGNCSAHRGLFCLEAEDFQLADFANRIPNFTAEVFTEGEEGFEKLAAYTPPAPPYSWWLGSFGYVDPHGEIWAMYYPSSTRYPYTGFANIFHWTLDRPADPVQESHQLWDADIVQEASLASYTRVRSDEPSAAAWGTNGQGVTMSYFQLEAGTRIDILSSESGAYTDPELCVKYGEEMYVAWGGFGNSGRVQKFTLGGIKLAESTVIGDAGQERPSDMGRSESFLWALIEATSMLLKIDKDTLELIGEPIPITGTTGILLAMHVVSDSDIRLFTATGTGTRFYLLDPESGVATLDKHFPGETYAAKRAFGRWGLRYVNGIYVVDFGGYTGGFAALIDFYGPVGSSEDIRLWKIVRDINIMAGLDSVVDSDPPTVGEIEVGELTDLVHGYSLTRAMSARDALEQLQQTYFFDGRETDLKLDYPKRGKPAVRSIPGADLSARSSINETLPDRLIQTRMRESEVPLRVHVVYNNYEAAYQQGHEYAGSPITDAHATLTVQIAVAINSIKAQQIATTILMLRRNERDSFTMRASRKHFRIDAADNVEVVITEE